MPSDELVVVTHGLTKQFGDFTAVNDFNLEVRGGTVVSLLDQAHQRERPSVRPRRRERVRHRA
jgi:hypothetical protein